MSIDVALINLDRKEFLRPQDMGLRSEIRAVESVPTLFHVAALRLVAAGSPWAGGRVALVHDAGGPGNPPPGLPSWDTICGRENGWRNILPDVIEGLVERHRPATDELFNGTISDLLRVLSEYVVSLQDELVDARQDAKDGWAPSEDYVLALEIELKTSKETLARLIAAGHVLDPTPSSSVDLSVELVRAVRDQCADEVAGCHYTEDTPDARDDILQLDPALLLSRARAKIADHEKKGTRDQ